MTDIRDQVQRWLTAAIEAVDPVELTRRALSGPPATVVGIGKAAAGMCRGAADALGSISGVCVTDAPDDVPDGVDLLIGDHPIPGLASLEAGERVLDTMRSASGRVVVLISGGGSALCEVPRSGIDFSFIQHANRLLLGAGASIDDANLVRGHLSSIKCGGLARASARPMETLIISDVAGSGPEVVASGPTLPMAFDPGRARATMEHFGIEVPKQTWRAMSEPPDPPGETTVQVLADGMVAADAAVHAAGSDGFAALTSDDWTSGPLARTLEQFLSRSRQGVVVAAGEVTLEVTGEGSGGRNSHAALLAAVQIADTGTVFAAFATDGVDGISNSAGAIVDGSTISRGGDPTQALVDFDSATYLDSTGDLLRTGPTGTNVADLWIVCDPTTGSAGQAS